MVRYLPYVALAVWFLYTRPSVWIDDSVIKYASDWYTAPLGIFSLFAPFSGHAIRLIETYSPAIQIIGILLFALPSRNSRIAGGLLASLTSLTVDGINYGSGKVDHQALSHSLPGLIALGEIIGDELLILKSALSFYYLQSVSGKALSGWLNFSHYAFRDWLVLYRDFYGLTTPVGRWLLSHEMGWHLGWKALDVLVVIGESLILLFWLAPKMKRFLGMQVLITFHFIILLTFGIDFATLLLPVYWWAMREPEMQGSTRSKAIWLGWGILAIASLNLTSGWIQFMALTAATGVGYFFDDQMMVGFLPSLRWNLLTQRRRFFLGAWAGYNSFALAFALLGREPFPSYGGPIFPGSATDGDCSGACVVSLVDSSGSLPSNNQNAKLTLSQLGLSAHSVATAGGLASQLKFLELEPRLWIPKIIQYLQATNRVDSNGIHCLNHDFIPAVADVRGLVSAVEAVERERKFQIKVQWTRFGSCPW